MFHCEIEKYRLEVTTTCVCFPSSREIKMPFTIDRVCGAATELLEKCGCITTAYELMTQLRARSSLMARTDCSCGTCTGTLSPVAFSIRFNEIDSVHN